MVISHSGFALSMIVYKDVEKKKHRETNNKMKYNIALPFHNLQAGNSLSSLQKKKL